MEAHANRNALMWTAACFVLSLCGAAHAGPGYWTTGGPYGAGVGPLAIDPSHPTTVYAGTPHAGVFKSTDSGATWSAANAGLSSYAVYALAIAPRTAARTSVSLYAGTNLGVYKSADAAGTWEPANTGLSAQDVYALAIDPRNPATLYAGTDGGVFKSTDAARTWAPANMGLTSHSPDGYIIAALAIDPSNPTTLYAGSDMGVFKSTDTAGTWALVYPNPRLFDVAGTIAIDPSNPATLYAGIDGVCCVPTVGSRVIKSTDSGATWTAVWFSPAGISLIGGLAIDPKTPSTLYLGVGGSHVGAGGDLLKSTDSGSTWAPAATGLPLSPIGDLAIDPGTPATLYAGTRDSGVFKSTDGGGTWAPTNTGLTLQNVYALVVDPTSPATLYTGTEALGVFKSTDSGGTWAPASPDSPPFQSVYALAIDPKNPAALYAGVIDGVFKSTDSGANWTNGCYTVATVLRIRALVFDPTNPATLYVGGDGGILKSVDAGTTCIEPGSNLRGYLVLALAPDPSAPATLYAGACDYDVVSGFPRPSGGVFKSTDSGGTWTAANSGLTSSCVRTLAVDPKNPATLYAGGRGGIFKSVDSGATWTAANKGLSNLDVGALVIHPTNPATLYAGTGGGGVFKSTDSGATWTAVNEGLANLDVAALALDPTGETTVYAGLRYGSVWQATPPTGGDHPTNFYTLRPCRLIDTRNATNTWGGPALAAGADRVFPLFGRCGIPDTARALSVNVTVTLSTAAGNLRLYPAGTPLPLASAINYAAGQTRANNAIAPLSERGKLAVRCSQSSGTVHFILDVNGYFE